VICSIDPPGCRDIDDALSCTFDEGVYKVGVHIADVTRFVTSGTALDDEARRFEKLVRLAGPHDIAEVWVDGVSVHRR